MENEKSTTYREGLPVVCRTCDEPLLEHEIHLGVCSYCLASPNKLFKSVTLSKPGYGNKR